jgi:hypothetical protein
LITREINAALQITVHLTEQDLPDERAIGHPRLLVVVILRRVLGVRAELLLVKYRANVDRGGFACHVTKFLEAHIPSERARLFVAA